MIQCSSCGRAIEKVPEWLQGTKVDFVCNNCPNRQTKNIAYISLEVDPKPKADDEDELEIDDLGDVEEE